MNKMKIKEFLYEARNESGTPGITMANTIHKKSGKENKDGISAMAKDMKDYDGKLKSDKETSKVVQNKYNYENDEVEYHDQMEIMNGQEMIEYNREPNKDFKDRAKEGLEGSSRMGNKGGKGVGNAEQMDGVSSDDFGKKRVKDAAASMKKRHDASKGLTSFGDDIETIPKNNAPMSKHSALSENKDTKTKESMKRLKFKKEIGGIGNALKLIPESYRVDEKVFEMTDGNENYRMRWEGTLNEGKAVILMASDKTMVASDMTHMKHLMEYKSEKTLGLLKGNSRIDENTTFNDMYNKVKLMVEGEDIEGKKAKEGDLDDATDIAPEATEHVEGSVSTDKGFKAPAPKTGSMESLDDATDIAPEATEHVEGSVSTDKGLKAPAPKTGHWEDISVPQAADAKKHVTMSEGVEIDGVFFGKLNEDLANEEIPVNNEDPKSQSGYVHEDEEDEMDTQIMDTPEMDAPEMDGPEMDANLPTASEPISKVKLMISKSTGEYFLIGGGPKPIPVPVQDKDIAKANPAKYLNDIMGDLDDDGNQF